MISTNLNAIDSWERGRRETEPETPDVDRTPGSERSPRTEIHKGSRGRERKPHQENDEASGKHHDEEPTDDATVVIDEADDDQMGRHVDIDA
ncbi:MAG: hypothetical protein EA382_14085 [Spirochaetaceae bacterium]|nr:MAG: hypothetical protein EA382_14085 [Spirochaetaceae bacterium]